MKIQILKNFVCEGLHYRKNEIYNLEDWSGRWYIYNSVGRDSIIVFKKLFDDRIAKGIIQVI